MLKLLVFLGLAAFLATLPLLVIALFAHQKFRQHLAEKHAITGRVSAWQSDKFLPSDNELLKKARKVRVATVVLISVFALALLSGLGISMIGV
jgi:hypothetical protein